MTHRAPVYEVEYMPCVSPMYVMGEESSSINRNPSASAASLTSSSEISNDRSGCCRSLLSAQWYSSGPALIQSPPSFKQ